MAASPERHADNLKPALAKALICAQRAVDSEDASATTAATWYNRAVSYLQAAVATSLLNGEQRLTATKLIQAYSDRREDLTRRQSLPPNATPSPGRTPGSPAASTEFTEIEIPTELPPVPPVEPYRKPIWLMNVLRQTIAGGGHLTPTIYVPKEMWYQNDVRFRALQPKYECVSTLVDFLSKLSKEDAEGTPQFTAALDDFINLLNEKQNELASHLSFVKTVPLSDRKVAKGKRLLSTTQLGNTGTLEETTVYVDALAAVCQKSQFLLQWMDAFALGPRDIHDRLVRIADFFNDVFLPMVLEDMRLLMERYVRFTTRAFIAD